MDARCIRELERENREFKRSKPIPKTASTFFEADLDGTARGFGRICGEGSEQIVWNRLRAERHCEPPTVTGKLILRVAKSSSFSDFDCVKFS